MTSYKQAVGHHASKEAPCEFHYCPSCGKPFIYVAGSTMCDACSKKEQRMGDEVI